MKKLLLLFLFAAFSVTSRAQGFTLITTPCHNDGILSVSFSGLTPPLTVSWILQGSAATTVVHTGVTGMTDILTGYSGGPLTAQAIDVFGATDTVRYYAGMPPFTLCAPVVMGAVCPLPDTLSISVCGGGTGPFHYTWYDIGTSAIVGTMNPIPVPTGHIYGVTVTDALGCTYGSLVDPLQVYAYTVPSFSDSMVTTTANCTNGTAAAYPIFGGIPPFTYLWSTGATSQSIGSLVTGTYRVLVTDAIGCTCSDSGFVNQSIAISAAVIPTPATCAAADGSVIAFASGGTPPYTYLWDNGATTNGQTGLYGGFYRVRATDANGCIGSGSNFVGNSTPIVVTYTTTPSLCTSGTGTATLTIAGGTLPYNVMWYTTPAQTGVTAVGLIAGTYSFVVTDALGCRQTGTVTVPPIDVISASYIATPAICTLSTGSITVYPTGGVLPYSYSWSTTGGSGATISSKPPGSYTVTITDYVGCKLTRSLYLPSNSSVHLSAVSTPASCIYANDGINSAYAWGGTSPYSYGWSTGGTTSTISGLPTGPYWVRVTDALGCTAPYTPYSYVAYDTLGTGCYCTIDGTIFHDVNNNCIQDPGENGIPNVQVHITGGSLSNVYVYTDATGYYSYKVPSGSYTVSETVQTFYPLSTCQLNNIHVTAVAGTGCLNTVNFSNSMDTVHDMHISTWDYTTASVGNLYTQVTVVTNDGTIPEDSIKTTYRPDGQLFSPTFIPNMYFNWTAPYYYTTDTFTALAPGEAKRFYMHYNVPTNIPMNTAVVFKDTVVHKDSMGIWVNDNTPWNNVVDFTTTIRASHDPNFKDVHPRGVGAAGTIAYTDSILEYMVHFQNTGNYMAENVVVIDTLDDNLNWSTLKPVFMQYNCEVVVMQSGVKKVARFTFKNINLLPQSTDEMRSNAMFTYTIHTKPGLPVGSTFRNRASIYFDYNEPVMTNTTVNTLGSTGPGVGINNTTAAVANSFSIYPNPATKSFNAIVNSSTTTSSVMKVADITGRILITKNIALQAGSQTIPVDASQLASGTYFVTLSSGGITGTQKLVIIK